MARPANTTAKRQELVEIAVTCFTRLGYHKTTLDAVAAEASMNKATLYHYFRNKEALFLQVMLYVGTIGITELQARTARVRIPAKKIIFYFSERLDFYLRIVKLNSLTREHLFELQTFFDQIYTPEKEKEIIFIAGILQHVLPTVSARQVMTHARLLFSVADAIKHAGIFTGQLLDNNDAVLADTRQLIASSITLLIRGIEGS